MMSRIFLFIVIATIAAGCRTVTEYVPVESVRMEYRDRLTERIDSMWLRDSVYVAEKGDTVRIERWRWRERYLYLHDTCYVERTDSVHVPYPVEKKLTRWQQAKMDLGGMAMGAVGLCLLFSVIWLIRRMKA